MDSFSTFTNCKSVTPNCCSPSSFDGSGKNAERSVQLPNFPVLLYRLLSIIAISWPYLLAAILVPLIPEAISFVGDIIPLLKGSNVSPASQDTRTPAFVAVAYTTETGGMIEILGHFSPTVKIVTAPSEFKVVCIDVTSRSAI